MRNVRHVLKLKRNLISIGQLADGEMKTIFDGDVCKILKGVMVMAHKKKEGTLYMICGSGASISVASSELNVGSMASETWAYELEGNEGYAFQE